MSETDPIVARKASRQEAKLRQFDRLKLIEKSVQQSRGDRGISDHDQHFRGKWNYDMAADSDIFTRGCPLCFQVYSDFEVTAVSPCWHCRDKISLSSAIGIAGSVSMDFDDRYSHEEVHAPDDVGQVEFIQDQIHRIESKKEVFKSDLRDAIRHHVITQRIGYGGWEAYNNVVRYRKALRDHMKGEVTKVQGLQDRIDAIEAGTEHEFLEEILRKGRALQKAKKLSY